MDLIKLKIPATFIRDRAPMSWRELKFGIDHELLDPAAIVDLAPEQSEQHDRGLNAWVDLARADPGAGSEIVDEFASAEQELSESEIRDKWLYLVLAWIYEYRGEFRDPLQIVEAVYADFGYPPEIEQFVRYMPMEGPDLGTREANEQRLIERWKNYLDARAAQHNTRPAT
jgi:hypothetical protein